MKNIFIGAAMASFILPVSNAQAEGPFRKVSGPAPGKCIFSSDLMPPDRYSDPAYSKVTSNFVEGEPIHIRCFYKQPLSHYAKLGSVANTLRNKNTYYVHLLWKRKFENNSGNDEHGLAVVWRSYTNPGLKRERFELMDSKNCSFEFKDFRAKKYGAFPSGCVNLGNNIRKYAENSRYRVPERTEICVRVRVASANGYRNRSTNTNNVREPDYRNTIIAEDCFNYKLDASKAGGSASSASANPLMGRVSEENSAASSSPSATSASTAPTAPRLKPTKPKKPKIKIPRVKIPGGIF
ncbi:hypothetical protein [Parasphingorhabdus sp.]|uniref:hypothetical protein n=1 Tax=Parasphingorhabdus sp. TaxID=2709688 RepID=UPI0032639EFC